MMKKLKINNEYYKINNEVIEVEKIIKTTNSIIGITNNQQTFKFSGISNSSKFTLDEGVEWDVEKNEMDELNEYILDLEFRMTKQELGI